MKKQVKIIKFIAVSSSSGAEVLKKNPDRQEAGPGLLRRAWEKPRDQGATFITPFMIAQWPG
jgi:hypothetical protein